MRNYGISRYMSYNRYRPTSLYNRRRTSIYQQFASKTNSANAARKAYQTTSAAKTTYTTNLSDAVSGIASLVPDLSKAMSGPDREKMYDAAKSFVDSYNDMYSVVSNSRNSFVSGRTSVMTNTAKAYSGTLEKAGVTVGKDGTLSIDKEKFMEADDKALSSALGKNSYIHKLGGIAGGECLALIGQLFVHELRRLLQKQPVRLRRNNAKRCACRESA